VDLLEVYFNSPSCRKSFQLFELLKMFKLKKPVILQLWIEIAIDARS